MIISKHASERLAVIRFPLIVGVVFIHAYGGLVNLKNTQSGVEQVGFFSQILQEFISHGVARVAVPLFFLMSGYLFFLGFKGSFESFKNKAKSRFKSLVIPFLFWNAFVMLLYFCAQSFPATSHYFSGSIQTISSYSLYDFFNAFFGFTQSPIAYQFWFIRDLVVILCMAPLLYALLRTKYLGELVLAMLALVWFIGLWPIYVPSIAALFFFYLGALLGQRNGNLFCVDRFGKPIAASYAVMLFFDILTKSYAFNEYIHNLGVMLGMATALYFSKWVIAQKRLKNTLIRLSTVSFFIFAVHEPMLTISKKLSYRMLQPSSDITISLLYLSLPTAIILLAIYFHGLIKKVMPNFLTLVSGGR
jgi:surface polysaccharide O-acyltransferase-like enzyme